MDSAALVTYDEQHTVPLGTCNGPTQGPMNPDGRCILGGVLMGAGLRGDSIPSVGYPSVGCMAYPVFAQEMVPYTNGVIAGDNYQRLATLKQGTKLLGQP
jgi:hypothetical protein